MHLENCFELAILIAENQIHTPARLNILVTGPIFSASVSNFCTSFDVLKSVVETITVTPYVFHKLIRIAWYPVVMPFRDVTINFFAPRSTSQSASSKPIPPKPPAH